MKKIKWSAFLLVLLLFVSTVACTGNGGAEQYSQEIADVELKQWGSAPNFVVLDEQGKAVQLSDFAGKPVVLNFWATWCGYCKLEMPDFDKAYAQYPDVVFLMINATDGVYETKEKASAYVKSEGFSFDVYYDVSGLAQNAYQLTGYPTTVFIDANGDVVSKEVGMISYETLVEGLKLITD